MPIIFNHSRLTSEANTGNHTPAVHMVSRRIYGATLTFCAINQISIWQHFFTCAQNIRNTSKSHVKQLRGNHAALQFAIVGLSYARLFDVRGIDVDSDSIGIAKQIWLKSKCFMRCKVPGFAMNIGILFSCGRVNLKCQGSDFQLGTKPIRCRKRWRWSWGGIQYEERQQSTIDRRRQRLQVCGLVHNA